MPRSILHAASWPHVWERAMPKGARREKIAARKMTPRRPSQSFSGSENHPALWRGKLEVAGRGFDFGGEVYVYLFLVSPPFFFPFRFPPLFTNSKLNMALKSYRRGGAYKRQMVMYGMELTRPMIQLFFAHSPSLAMGPQLDPLESGMPRASGKDRLAPLEPV